MKDMTMVLAEQARESIAAHERYLREAPPALAKVAEVMLAGLRGGGTLFFFGNGGSAADAQHVAAELVGRFRRERDPLAAIALTTDTSILTAVGNDWEFAEVFARQVRALVRKGDVAVGISTSGKSENVLRALRAAREKSAVTVGFTGARPGPLDDLTDVCFHAPADETSRIQELHLLAWHSLSEIVESEMATKA